MQLTCRVANVVRSFLVLTVMLLPQLVLSDYYVSTYGNDSNPGTSASPWKTIQKAANTMHPGDTVIIRSGDYDEFVTINRSGTSETEPLVFKSEKLHAAKCAGFLIQGDYITLDGFDVEVDGVTRWTGIRVYGRSNVTVQNCYVHECPIGGIRFDYPSANATILTNTLEHNGQNGIHLSGTNGWIEGNLISRTVQYHPKGLEPGFSGADADGIRLFGDGHTVRRNRVENIADPADAGNVDPHADGIQTWDNAPGGTPILTNTVIENNYFYINHPSGKGIIIDVANGNPCHHLTIRNNIFEFRDIGISAYSGEVHDLFIYNNLFKSNTVQTQWGTSMSLGDVTNYAVLNNIMVDCRTQYRKITGGSGTVDYNLAWSSTGSGFSLTPPLQTNEIKDQDPRFVTYTGNHNENDYHLQTGSAAIDKGIDPGDVVDDYDGVARPSGIGCDIGPFEYVASEIPYATTDTTARIARWKDNKTGALIIGFDDSTPGQATLGVPALNARHLVGTWYVNPGATYYDMHRTAWETTAPAGGQELANHTMNHRGASTYAEIVTEVGDAANAIWQIRGQAANGSLIAFNRGGGTSWNETDLANVLNDYNNIDRSSYLGPGITKHALSVLPGSSADTIYNFVPPIIDNGQLAILRFHGISATNGSPPMDNGNAAVWVTEFGNALDRLDNLKSKVWNCGEIQLYKYCRERHTATVSIAQYSEDRFKIQLTTTSETSDTKYYDEPLTVVISDLPLHWGKCIVSHEDTEVTLPITNREALINVRPNRGDITLYAVTASVIPEPTPTPTTEATPELTTKDNKAGVYPVPFAKGSGQSLTFYNLKGQSTIQIFTIDGNLAISVQTDQSRYALTSVKLAPGIFIYLINNDRGMQKGKIVISQ